jgi:hypothetical protein
MAVIILFDPMHHSTVTSTSWWQVGQWMRLSRATHFRFMHCSEYMLCSPHIEKTLLGSKTCITSLICVYHIAPLEEQCHNSKNAHFVLCPQEICLRPYLPSGIASHVYFLKWPREGRSVVLLMRLHRPSQWFFLFPEKLYFSSCDSVLLGVRYDKLCCRQYRQDASFQIFITDFPRSCLCHYHHVSFHSCAPVWYLN